MNGDGLKLKALSSYIDREMKKASLDAVALNQKFKLKEVFL